MTILDCIGTAKKGSSIPCSAVEPNNNVETESQNQEPVLCDSDIMDDFMCKHNAT